jgi:ribokinase
MVGSSMIDLVARVPRLVQPGETLIGSHFQVGYGGKGANQAVMAARLGAQVSVVTRLGRDVFGEDTLKNYQGQGINTTHVLFDDTRFSGVAPITVDEVTGQNAIVVIPGANLGLSPADARQATAAIQGAKVLICQLEVPIETTLEAFRIAKEDQNMAPITILNPAPAAALSDDLLRLTDVLVPNEVEAAMLAGVQSMDTIGDVIAAARVLQRRGPETVIITLGKNGALFLEGDREPQHVAAEQVRAIDSTGAGDAFVGSLAFFLASGRPLRDAIERACAIATHSVLSNGTQSSFPKGEDVAHLLRW